MGDWVMSDILKGMTPRLIGETYMKYPTEKSSKKGRYGLYECAYCGKEFEGSVYSVKRGQTKSCGCLRGDAHGLTSHKFYNTWYNMKSRCFRVTNKEYKNYGGRGITVCGEWLSSATFIDWCESTHPNINNYSLDRIDNDKGYSPDNCRWVDKSTQCVNQRIRKDNTSGYVGVAWNPNNKKWRAYISINTINKYLGSFLTIEDAILARDNYIIENGLPHPISSLSGKEKVNE